ncbi:GAF domain-containing protein [Roseicyclus mahoneyensis]|uniref:GAF domain-containing protein n=1 Tax=Roseicyclus mahoneyensis TaxID=164332 RepID=A0A316GFW9_9RHOB|nr:GAF domain-containing protein [Roseicyclus mahoneyensis]PWK59584.1 GAF domain-containing protein [Roseicyclus mahoneyensis]
MERPDFKPARLPTNEDSRLSAVRRTGLMGSQALARFEIYTRLFRHIAGVPVSYTGLLDEARQYFLSENFTGCLTGATEVARENTVCQHALLDTKPFVVPDMRLHPTFEAHPLVTSDPHWVFWAGFPLVTQEGYILGTICAVDFVARDLTAEQLDLLTGVAADLTLSIQLQTDHQERVAGACDAVLASLQGAGVQGLTAARGFFSLCRELPVTPEQEAQLLATGLATRSDGQLLLSAAGNTLKTGHGLGPAEYKTRTSPLRDTDMLDAMFDMITEAEG